MGHYTTLHLPERPHLWRRDEPLSLVSRNPIHAIPSRARTDGAPIMVEIQEEWIIQLQAIIEEHDLLLKAERRLLESLKKEG